MHLLGYGFPHHGFFNLQILGLKLETPSRNMANIQIISGEATVARVEEKLKHLVGNKLD